VRKGQCLFAAFKSQNGKEREKKYGKISFVVAKLDF
jgi:hypothetical protein